jgi:endo-1,4-beta-xylanase
MIVIGVNGLYGALYCDDVTGKRPVESIIMQELISHVDATYRTIPTRAGRGVEGFSRGGLGAAHLAFKYPATFGVLSMLAGSFYTGESLPRMRPHVFKDYFGGDQARWDLENSWDLATAAAASGMPPMPMRMIVGDADTDQYPGNVRYHQHLQALGLPCELVVIPGVDHSSRRIYDNYAGNPFSFFSALATSA